MNTGSVFFSLQCVDKHAYAYDCEVDHVRFSLGFGPPVRVLSYVTRNRLSIFAISRDIISSKKKMPRPFDHEGSRAFKGKCRAPVHFTSVLEDGIFSWDL